MLRNEAHIGVPHCPRCMASPTVDGSTAQAGHTTGARIHCLPAPGAPGSIVPDVNCLPAVWCLFSQFNIGQILHDARHLWMACKDERAVRPSSQYLYLFGSMWFAVNMDGIHQPQHALQTRNCVKPDSIQAPLHTPQQQCHDLLHRYHYVFRLHAVCPTPPGQGREPMLLNRTHRSGGSRAHTWQAPTTRACTLFMLNSEINYKHNCF